MSYDIFGNQLQKGHCEVHPHVHEEYPCSLCYSESSQRLQQKRYMDSQEQQYYDDLTNYHREGWLEDNSILYRLIVKLESMVAKLKSIIRKRALKKCPV